jgi:hypothetical protein
MQERNMRPRQGLSRWLLRIDGIFLCVAGGAAMTSETLGHFLGIGPLAATRGSPHTIGGFEAHGLAILIGVLLVLSAKQSDRRMWHIVGLTTHLFLGGSNLLYWSSFVELNVVSVGIVTTVFHAVFVLLHGVCLARASPAEMR